MECPPQRGSKKVSRYKKTSQDREATGKSVLGFSSPCLLLNCHHLELLIIKFRLKLKKVGKTTRPFRYDLNQIPYDYTVEVRNRFKGLDLIDRVPDEQWNEVHDIVQETGIKTIPMERKPFELGCRN